MTFSRTPREREPMCSWWTKSVFDILREEMTTSSPRRNAQKPPLQPRRSVLMEKPRFSLDKMAAAPEKSVRDTAAESAEGYFCKSTGDN